MDREFMVVKECLDRLDKVELSLTGRMMEYYLIEDKVSRLEIGTVIIAAFCLVLAAYVVFVK